MNLRKDVTDSGKSHVPFHATPTVVRKHISDRRENPELTTTTHCKLSGPLGHKIRRNWSGGVIRSQEEGGGDSVCVYK